MDHVQVLRTFAVAEEDEAVSRVQFGAPPDAPVLLALARLHPKKAMDILLKALVNVPKAHLWIAGDGPLRDELEQLSQSLGLQDRVRFLGWRNDRAALLKASDVCVFPSRYEPFGTVMVEAWAYDIPLVTAASAGPKAHVINGENGLLVPIDDIEALTDAINSVLSDSKLRKKIIAGGRKTYESTFTEEKVVESYTNFYKKILRRK